MSGQYQGKVGCATLGRGWVNVRRDGELGEYCPQILVMSLQLPSTLQAAVAADLELVRLEV